MHWSKNPKIREQVIKKMSEANKGKVGYWRGKKKSPEHLEKIGNSLKGRESWIKGKHHTKDTKKKISEALTGVPNLKRRKISNENEVCKEYKNGESTVTLGKKYNVSYNVINHILKRNNISIRTDREKTLNAIKQNRSSNTECQRMAAKKGFTGKNNPRWTGGWYVDKHNYKWIHDKSGRWRKEHRVLVEEIIGRDLLRTETIHHINENKLDNRISNLYYYPNDSLHKSYHGLKNKPKLKSNIWTLTLTNA